MKIDLATTVKRLKAADNILILTHRRPDGDTIGAGLGLHYALKSLNKTSRVICADPFPDKFDYLLEDYSDRDFQPEYIVAVDTATTGLLGGLEETYGDKVDLVIDHHKSNSFYGKETYLALDAPATCEAMYFIVEGLGAKWSIDTANALFTGLVTDTGGFRHQSVTPASHRVAAALMEKGAEHGKINQIIFESISRERLKVEALARETMEFYLSGQLALLYFPSDMEGKFGVAEEELDGMSALPRMIQGVNIGVTMRDLGNGDYRVSMRSRNPVDSAAICAYFGGGGHTNAAGCTISGSVEEAKKKIVDAVAHELARHKQ